MNFETKIVIKEYCTRRCIKRGSGTDSKVFVRSEDSKDLIEKGRMEFLDRIKALAARKNAFLSMVKECFEENNTAYMMLEKALVYEKVSPSRFYSYQAS